MTSEFFARNLRAFQDSHPSLARIVAATQDTVSRRIEEDGRAVDIDLGNGRLYKEPADAFVRRQMDDYFKDPERIILKGPEGVYADSPISREFLDDLRHVISAAGVESLPGGPRGRPEAVVVFGLGLGLHVEPLLERLDPHHVIFIEPVAEFLVHSLHTVDWARLLEENEARERTFYFVSSQNLDHLYSTLMQLLDGIGWVFVEGAYLYQHYPSWLLNTLRAKFKSLVGSKLKTLGFFEDETRMVSNFAENLTRYDGHLIDGVPRQRREIPAFVVASGPSVNACLDTIKQWQGHAMIFAAGSAAQVLLHHGIVPDFHVELENLPVVAEKVRHIWERNQDRFPNGTFEGVTYIGSCTAAPDIGQYFDDRFFFFRDSVSSSRSFARNFRHIYGCAPLGLNTTLCLAAVLGFYKIHLFGCDCGVREGSPTHSEHTIWYTADQFKGVAYNDFPYSYPANFGGEVRCNELYDWSRRMAESVIANYRLDVHNCSDGALIEGARPRMHTAVSFDHPVDKAAVKQAMRDESGFFRRGEFLRQQGIDTYPAAWDALVDDFRTLYAEAREAGDDFKAFHERLSYWTHWRGDMAHQGCPAMLSGSLRAFETTASYALRRIEDAEQRAEATAGYIELMEEYSMRMIKEGRALFDKAAADVAAIEAEREREATAS